MNRVVIVTGGGTGIGKAIVQKFADNGDIVYAMGRREAPLKEVAGYKSANIRPLVADITDPTSMEQAVNAIKADHERVDVLVNCAGGSGHVDPGMPLADAWASWTEVIEKNLSGAFLVTYAFTPLLKRPGGRIILITSLAAFAGSSRVGGEAYAAAKAGVHGMMRTLVRRLGPEGITVNSVAPGLIDDTEFFGSPLTSQRIEEIASTTPVRRIGAPADIAPAVFYLASDEASFVNGDILNVNGGQQFSR